MSYYSEIIIERGPNQLTAQHLREILFDEDLSGEHIDTYLSLLCSTNVMNEHGHDIEYVSSSATAELLMRPRLPLDNMSDEDLKSVCADFTCFGIAAFEKLHLINVYSKKHILMPVNPDNHWFLVVLNPSDKFFHHWNSINSSERFHHYANYVVSPYSRVITETFCIGMVIE